GNSGRFTVVTMRGFAQVADTIGDGNLGVRAKKRAPFAVERTLSVSASGSDRHVVWRLVQPRKAATRSLWRSPDDQKRRNALTTFTELAVIAPTAQALARVGTIAAFPIQELAVPVALTGSDLIGQARTGTGKTYAFSVPILQRIVVPS